MDDVISNRDDECGDAPDKQSNQILEEINKVAIDSGDVIDNDPRHIGGEHMDDNIEYDEQQYAAMIGKLLKQHPTVRLHDDDIKFDLNCAYCVNLKQDVLNLHYWKKVYEKSAKETV